MIGKLRKAIATVVAALWANIPENDLGNVRP